MTCHVAVSFGWRPGSEVTAGWATLQAVRNRGMLDRATPAIKGNFERDRE